MLTFLFSTLVRIFISTINQTFLNFTIIVNLIFKLNYHTHIIILVSEVVFLIYFDHHYLINLLTFKFLI